MVGFDDVLSLLAMISSPHNRHLFCFPLWLRNQQPADGHGCNQADQNGLHHRDACVRSEHTRHNGEE
jgi:hypothetical protein